MNYLDEKPEHFAKTAFAKNRPKPQKTNKPQKKNPSREYKIYVECMSHHTCKVDSMCGLSWSRNTKYSDKEGNAALHLFFNASKSSERIAMLKISCC